MKEYPTEFKLKLIKELKKFHRVKAEQKTKKARKPFKFVFYSYLSILLNITNDPGNV